MHCTDWSMYVYIPVAKNGGICLTAARSGAVNAITVTENFPNMATNKTLTSSILFNLGIGYNVQLVGSLDECVVC